MPELQVGLLGQFAVTVGERPIRLTGGRLRALLAVLAMSAGRAVPVDRLATGVWLHELPGNSRRSLHTYASRLRAALGEKVIGTTLAGFVLNADPEAVDALRFVRLLDEAATVDPEGERRLLDEALALWRGDPFADAGSQWLIEAEAPRLTERYLSALERRIDLDLADGRLDGLAGRLTDLAARFPLREPLWVRLLVALDRSGRQAEALARYEHIRVRLAEELGADPGAELRQVYADLLAGRPTRQARGTVAARRASTPRELPADVATLFGRTSELARLGRIDDASTVVITAIDGMAGVGKTALAVHAAHRLADRYPDGQLFLDLHGFTDGAAPVEPAEALDRILRTLGVPGDQIPPGVDDRAALYRSRLADRRVLIVLDNAADEAQVAPLLPGAPGSLVLMTSRSRLLGLDRAHTLSLDVLPVPDAVALFSHTVGDRAVAGSSPELLAEVVELCGRLPLAIRIAAARLRARPTWTVADLAERLGGHQHRLAELAAGQRSVAAALDLSYQQLPPDQRRAYRLLALHPGADLAVDTAAALIGRPVPPTRRLLDSLIDAHLVQEQPGGRYRMHDLVRHHATEVAVRGETEPDRRAALARLLDHYAGGATAAMDAAYPYERNRRPRPPAAGAPGEAFADARAATAWLDTELPNLLAAAKYAAVHDWPDHARHLPVTLHRHLLARSFLATAAALHNRALELARAAGDATGEVRALLGMADTHRLGGRHDEATEIYVATLEIARAVGDGVGRVEAWNGYAGELGLHGQFEAARAHYEAALGLARRIGDDAGAQEALSRLGLLYRLQDQPDRAIECLTQALELARATGNHIGEVSALSGTGHLHLEQGRPGPAERCFAAALRRARTVGHRMHELDVLCDLGRVYRVQGRYSEAADRYRQALQIAGEIGSRNWQLEALHGLGRLHHAAGRREEAISCHQRALALATELNQLLDQARVHDGLALVYQARCQGDEARRHWQLALDILEKLGTDRTVDDMVTVPAIQAHLEELGSLTG